MLPNKLDSYDALMARNVAIEHELGTYPSSWGDIRSQSIIEKYRNPLNWQEAERYPNVDWQKALFKDFTSSYSTNLSVSGGTSFVKYFTSADFVHEGDLFKVWDNGRNYQSGYGYNRLNVRSNLDFTLTKTTLLKVNLAGSNGAKKKSLESDQLLRLGSSSAVGGCLQYCAGCIPSQVRRWILGILS